MSSRTFARSAFGVRCILESLSRFAEKRVYRHDTHMTRGLSSKVQSQKKLALKRASKSVQNTSPEGNFRARSELLCAGAVFVVALLLYTFTLAPTVTLVDSGELIVAARGLGVAHPPGFPLWVMLAHLASLLPFGNIAARINFSSALFAALACAMLTLVVTELLIVASSFAGLKERARLRSRAKNVRI